MKMNKTIAIFGVIFLFLASYALAWTVSGTVYFSVNHTAVAAEGVTVNLTNVSGSLLGSMVTSAGGAYSFTTAGSPPPPRILIADIPNHPEISPYSKPTSPLGSDQVIDLSFPFECPDSDNDAYFASWCGGDDQNDSDPLSYVGAADICDGKDNDFNASTADGSGEAAPLNTNQAAICAASTKKCIAGVWTDDYSSVAGYEAVETSCDGIDNDCDGSVDIGLFATFYVDTDSDGYGDNAVTVTDQCTAPAGYVADNTDCDDTESKINPRETDICGNGIDEDCSGADLVCSVRRSSGGGGHSSSVMPPGWYASSTNSEETDATPSSDSSTDITTEEIATQPSQSESTTTVQKEGDEALLPTTGEASGFLSGKNGARNLGLILVIIAGIAGILAISFFSRKK